MGVETIIIQGDEQESGLILLLKVYHLEIVRFRLYTNLYVFHHEETGYILGPCSVP